MSEKCPEGEKWIEVPPSQVSITQLSVSPSGVVWGVTWQGVAVVRIGVTFYEPTGKKGENYLRAFRKSNSFDVRSRKKNYFLVFQTKMLHQTYVKYKRLTRT